MLYRYSTHVLKVFYTYITGVLHMYYWCSTHVLQVFYTCITDVLHMYYRCSTHVLQVFYTCITGIWITYIYIIHQKSDVLHWYHRCNTHVALFHNILTCKWDADKHLLKMQHKCKISSLGGVYVKKMIKHLTFQTMEWSIHNSYYFCLHPQISKPFSTLIPSTKMNAII